MEGFIEKFKKWQATRDFTMWELVRSQDHPQFVTDLPSEITGVLLHGAESMLQKLRDHYKVPISVTSGYRNKTLNKAVGGVEPSIHEARHDPAHDGYPVCAFDIYWAALDNLQVFRQMPLLVALYPEIRTVIYYPKEGPSGRFHIDNRRGRQQPWIGHSVTKGVYRELAGNEITDYGKGPK